MVFSTQFLDEVRARVSLTDVVGQRVRLTKRGREHVGLCPFHKEKTASFKVNEDKGFYHCFGCGAHGSVFRFVMDAHSVSFPEAVKRLAAEAGLEVPADTPEERQRARRHKTLHAVMEAAEAWFERTLRLPEGKAALDYLKGRGLDDETIGRYHLGFAPPSRGALKAALGRQGVDEERLVAAGLLVVPDDAGGGAPYDRFRGRVTFPITDRRGRVIAFGGRVLGDGEPKYLNSPETELFSKRSVLYGLAQAEAGARRSGRLIVTEGYMDVIALHGAGFDEAVAPLGTALSEEHMGAMWRIVRTPVLCFDGDAAGARAAARAAERALPVVRPGYSLAFATMPRGHDPDSLIRRQGAAAMARVVDAAVPLSEVLWQMETGGRVPVRPEDRAALEKRLEDHARRIADASVRAHFRRAFRERLWAKRDGTRRGGAAPSMDLDSRLGPATRIDSRRRRHQILLAALLNHPELHEDGLERLGTMEFSEPDLDKFRQQVLMALAQEADLDSAALKDQLRQRGCSEALDSVLSAEVYNHADFARLGASPEEARQGWDETLDRFWHEDLQAQIREAEKGFAERPTAEAARRLQALKRQELEAAEAADLGAP